MTRDDWRQSVPDAETFDQLFERAKRKSEVPAAPRFGIKAVRIPPRPTPRSAPRPQARVVINAERALGVPEMTPEGPRAAPVSIRFGAPNGPLDVRCGTWFVRLARPGEDFPPEWMGAGETVRVACQAATTVDLGSGQSALVLKRSPR